MKVIGRLYCRHVTTGGAAVEGGAAGRFFKLCEHYHATIHHSLHPCVCPVV